MLSNLKELKNFMIWCKNNKVKSFKIKDLNFELSDLAFLDQGLSIDHLEKAQEVTEEANLQETHDTKEEEDLLFWSVD